MLLWVDRSILNDPNGNMPDARLGKSIASRIRDKFPDTTIVFFSDHTEQDFGSVRFSEEEEYKGYDLVENTLGAFVTGLPSQARK